MKFPSITPSKFPFFYGYIIVVVGTLGILASLPGQTSGISTFTDPVKDALHLTRNQISIAYMIGTFVSSLFLGYAGRWFDKYGARKVAFFAAIGLFTSLFLCSKSKIIYEFLIHLFHTSASLIPFLLITILFFMLRFSGQGVLTLASRNMVMKWFDVLRGRMNAISSTAVSLGFSSAPWWINKLISNYGWQNSWWLMSIGLLFFTLIIGIFFRDKPEDFNLIPDGKRILKKQKEIPSLTRKQFTRVEAVKTRAFWVYSFTLSFYSFFFTGMTFHIISIFESSGYNHDQAVAIFIPISVVSVGISLIANYLSDWIKLKILLYIFLFGGLLSSLGIILLSSSAGIGLIIVGNGIMGGLFSVLMAVVWPRFYGREHLGAISGKSMSMIVAASAIGPALYSFSKTFLSTYAGIGVISMIFLTFVSIASKKANNPQ